MKYPHHQKFQNRRSFLKFVPPPTTTMASVNCSSEGRRWQEQGTRFPLNDLLPCTEVDHWFLKLLGCGQDLTAAGST
ncbi:uncharacterized protein BDW43DRAFT_286026 [Aspergillus alliaceus]|uniref:uncharacterized protein n=1 Tax=Petromyces alliaceus TaxID=209559 RepID=UPI0012A4A8A2|nr:uncharacterized protein BDW43DRAFT_286026 [Aspergillus alliaceus]KAB8230285.1 hypothetical protein BDW43DRAFT_286026 [Aspergillus alliaceus]